MCIVHRTLCIVHRASYIEHRIQSIVHRVVYRSGLHLHRSTPACGARPGLVSAGAQPLGVAHSTCLRSPAAPGRCPWARGLGALSALPSVEPPEACVSSALHGVLASRLRARRVAGCLHPTLGRAITPRPGLKGGGATLIRPRWTTRRVIRTRAWEGRLVYCTVVYRTAPPCIVLHGGESWGPGYRHPAGVCNLLPANIAHVCQSASRHASCGVHVAWQHRSPSHASCSAAAYRVALRVPSTVHAQNALPARASGGGCDMYCCHI